MDASDLSDPFAGVPNAAPATRKRGPAARPRSRARPAAPVAPPQTADDSSAGDAAGASTYEFRWDVAVEGTERRYGQKFMKQWKRVLQAQKMGPLVSAKLSPREARFQLCLTEEGDDANARQAEVLAELSHLRWRDAPEQHIHAENAERGGASSTPGFQGVRVWMTFARQDVETVLGKKPKI